MFTVTGFVLSSQRLVLPTTTPSTGVLGKPEIRKTYPLGAAFPEGARSMRIFMRQASERSMSCGTGLSDVVAVGPGTKEPILSGILFP